MGLRENARAALFQPDLELDELVGEAACHDDAAVGQLAGPPRTRRVHRRGQRGPRVGARVVDLAAAEPGRAVRAAADQQPAVREPTCCGAGAGL